MVGNSLLLAHLASVAMQAGTAAYLDRWPAMLNRWLGWLSSLEPVPDPTELVTPQALAAREASSDEEALLGTHPVPRANNPAQSHSPCVHAGDEVPTWQVLADSSCSNRKLGNQQDGTESTAD